MKETCAEIEILLCDYVDGTLPTADRARVDLHLAECGACSEIVQDTRSVAAFLSAAPDLEPPPELITRILFHTQHAEAKPAADTPSVPKTGWQRAAAWIHSLIEPVLQPRFAMGMAMTILSFSMIGRFAGVSERQITPADLDPVKIWMNIDNKAHRMWERAVKYYENLRVVYEIQNTLSEWSAQEEEDRRTQQAGGELSPRTAGQGSKGTAEDTPAERRDNQ